MHSYRTSLFFAGVITTSVAVSPVFAQTAADSASTSASGVEEIIVTAQRRAENLQKIPVTVTAVSAKALANANIDTALNLERLVPALKLTPESNTVTTFLRGVGTNIASIGNEASVAVYVDGVYYSRLPPVLFRLNNVERIEVLKGPQGTLFGRNASGGLVQIITKTPKPGQDFQFEAQVGYGNYDTVDASVYSATSLGANAALDVSAVVHNQADGWGKNVTTGNDHYTENSKAIRSKLVVNLGPDTRLRLTGEYAEYDSSIGIFKGGYPGGSPQGSLNPTPGQGLLPPVGTYDDQGEVDAAGSGHLASGAARIEHDLSFATLINTLAYQATKQTALTDLDLSPSPLLVFRYPSTTTQLTNELQLISKAGTRFDWSVGIFYMDQKQKYTAADFYGTLIGGDNINQSFSGVKSLSGYAQGRYEIVSGLKVTLGGRYSRDKLHGFGLQTLQPFGGAEFVIPGTTFDDRRTIKKFSYKAALDYQFTPDVLGYASVSRGYKGATYNTLPFLPTPAKPEIVEAYEIGVKSDLFDRRIRLNGAAFWYDITNLQVSTVPGPGRSETSNAESARIKGLEIEAQFVPTERLRFHAAATYLHARYTGYLNAPFIFPNPVFPFGNLPGVSGDASGKTMVRAPKFSGNVGVDYRIPMANGGELAISSNLSFTSKFFWAPDNRLTQPGYSLVDGQVSYTFPDKKLELRVWGSNLANKKYYYNQNAIGSFQGDVGAPGAPRTYGVSAGYKF